VYRNFFDPAQPADTNKEPHSSVVDGAEARDLGVEGFIDK
jgi:hypothetical protein